MSADEELLAGLVSGEIADDDPRAVEALAQSPELRETVERLRRLRARLEGVAQFEQGLEEVSLGGKADGVLAAQIRERVLASYDERPSGPPVEGVGVDPSPAPAPILRPAGGAFGRIAAAVAALLLVALGARLLLPSDSGGRIGSGVEVHMGSSGDFAIEPRFEGEALVGLTWEPQDLRGGRSYRVRISAPGLAGGVEEWVLDKPELTLKDPLPWSSKTRVEVVVVGIELLNEYGRSVYSAE